MTGPHRSRGLRRLRPAPPEIASPQGELIDGGAAKELTHYDSGQNFQFDISREGQLALARGSQSSDAVLIRKFE